MKTYYSLKKYYRELLDAINRYNKLIDDDMKELDRLINQQSVFNVLGFKKISLINYKINHDSMIDSIIETIQIYYDIKSAKENKLMQIERKIKAYELYLEQKHLI